MNSSQQSALEQCQAFLGAIFEPEDIIEFRCLKPATKQWGSLADLPGIIHELSRLNSAGRHCYFGANPRRDRGGATEADVLLARCVFVDFDGGATVEEARCRLNSAGLPEPTVTITSGGGVHCWWRLLEPITDMSAWRSHQKALIAALSSDPAIHDPPRIMRLPAFVNHKYKNKPLAAIVEIDMSRRYSLAAVTPASRGMSESTRAFLDQGETGGAGRRETMFAAACDLRDRGWTPEAAVQVIMPRMQALGLTAEDLEDCPRQIRNAWKREPRATLAPGKPARPAPPIDPWQPFPVELLPEPLRAFVVEASQSMRIDPAFVAMPLLPAVAAAIGMSRMIEPRPDWREPSILWGAVVAGSGGGKSPGWRSSMTFTKEQEALSAERNRQRKIDHRRDRLVYETELAAWKKAALRGTSEAPPDEPPEIIKERRLVEDTTVEALAPILASNPRGVLLSVDELSGWIGSMDRYVARGGGDAAKWLQLFNGDSATIDRKSGDIDVRHAAVSVCGGIQPEVAEKTLLGINAANGLLPRFMLASPPETERVWKTEPISFMTLDAMRQLVGTLYELPMPEDGPAIIDLDHDAAKAFGRFYEQLDLSSSHGAVRSMLSKNCGLAARLALVVHTVRQVADANLRSCIDLASVQAGIGLAQWFAYEWKRVFRLLAEGEEHRAVRQADERLYRWIVAQGGEVAVRDIIAGCRWIATAEEAEEALNRLVAAGRGRWQPRPATEAGGRPTRVFSLLVSAQPAKTRGKTGCADADNGGECENEAWEAA